MANAEARLLKVFLCHASGDKAQVRDLYKRLTAEGVDAWLDQENLLPGQDWRVEIPRAVHEADVVVICLSKQSITKEGYVQKEIKFALDAAEEKPEGTIFLIPARLEDCPVPERLGRWQWVDLYEENGFIKLLRSLKLRADATGAAIMPGPYEDASREIERRLEQLYTEGLAAFYTEDWDRACHRFQTILSERPNHRNASEKLAEAERQRQLAALYSQATAAYQAGDWPVAIRSLEELVGESADYKDAGLLLKNSRRQKRLTELYAEAKALHAARKWDAVLKVFEQISTIDSAYSDAEGLLPSAQKEVAEARRIAELNDLYSRAVEEMDTSHWAEARRLLEQIHKSQTGFLETERLLRKVESEIARAEEIDRRNNQVNILYEQAHGLVRSRNWRKALDKVEEIQALDEHFIDKDEIAEKARAELEREEQEVQKQDRLAAMYAEAVRLSKEGKYQEALDKFQDVRAVDPKYPDRQGVQRTAKRKLTEAGQPIHVKPRIKLAKPFWLGGIGIIAVAAIIAGALLVGKEGQTNVPAPLRVLTKTSALRTVKPAATGIPVNTNTPRPATAVPASGGYIDPTMYDDFDVAKYNGGFNVSLWGQNTDNQNKVSITQRDGNLVINVNSVNMTGVNHNYIRITQPTFFEMRAYLDPNTTDNGSHLFLVIGNESGYSNCGTFSSGANRQDIKCWSEYYGYGKKVEANLGMNKVEPGWHVYRFEIEPETMIIAYFIDGRRMADYNPKNVIPEHFNEFKASSFYFSIGLNNFGSASSPVGYVDYVRVGAIAQDPTVYDDFSNITYDGKFDPSKWTVEQHDADGSALQQGGVLVFTQGGINQRQSLWAVNMGSYKLTESYVIEVNLKTDLTNDGFVTMGLDIGNLNWGAGLHSMSDVAMAHFFTSSGLPGWEVSRDAWHLFRIVVSTSDNTLSYYIDGKLFGKEPAGQTLRGLTPSLRIMVSVGPDRVKNTRPMVGYVDNVRVYPLECIYP